MIALNMPEAWAAKRLKELSPSQSVGVVVNPSSYFDDSGTVPFLVGSNLRENAIHWQSSRRISKASNQLLASSRLNAGDLVTVRVGEPGVTAVVPAELDGCNCASMMIIRQHSTFDSMWLCYLMNSRIGRAQIESVQYGTAQKCFNIGDAVNFVYPTPPLREQRAIARALGDVDVLLDGVDRLIAKKRDLKQAVMQQLLTGQTRLPGFRGKWPVTTLGAVGRWFSGGTPAMANPTFWLGDIPWVSPKDMKVSRIHGAIDHVSSAAIGNGTRLLPAGAILVVVRGMILAHSAPVARAERPVAFNQDIKGLVVNPDVDSNIILWWLVAHESLLLATTTESTHGTKRLPTDELFKLTLNLPSLDEQAEIATVLTDMDAEIAALEARRDKTRLLKQGMMQELLTGRTRLV